MRPTAKGATGHTSMPTVDTALVPAFAAQYLALARELKALLDEK